jgi:hypothetical protein
MLRRVLAIAAGVVAAMAIIFVVEAAGRALFPLPSGMSFEDAESVRGQMESIPIGAFVSVLVAWMAGAFGGSYVAGRLLGRGGAAWAYVAGGVVLVGAALTTMRIPHPLWFVLATPLLIIGATVLGTWPSRARRRTASHATAK